MNKMKICNSNINNENNVNSNNNINNENNNEKWKY